MNASGLNISEYFSDGNSPQKLLRRQVNSQWNDVTVVFEKKPVFRFPGGQRQMHQNATSIWGTSNFRRNSPLNYISEFIDHCKRNDADVCFVVNINDEMQYGEDNSIQTIQALKLIKDAGLFIRLIEFGNEIYMNPTITGTGRFKAGLLYNLMAKKPNIQAASDYVNRALYYKNLILANGIVNNFAFCMAQDLNQAFKDWNDTVMGANIQDIGYALHLYPEKWDISKANIEKQLSAHFRRFEGKQVYFTELALQNGSTGMAYIKGYDCKKFWATFEPVLRSKFGNDVMTILWRMGSIKPNSYDFYKI